MKYFLDTEFTEGTQNKTFLGIKIGKTKPTIDLISIGIVSEEFYNPGGILSDYITGKNTTNNSGNSSREYYAISKDFNLKEAWNRFQLDGDGSKTLKGQRIYWIRNNVLLPIYKEHVHGDMRNHIPFSYSVMKGILQEFGKTNRQIAEEVKEFIYNKEDILYNHEDCKVNHIGEVRSNIEFYGYYCDYDWVVFCWLFGKMIDLPKGFPMYCIDLKQTLDEKIMNYSDNEYSRKFHIAPSNDLEVRLNTIKYEYNYPKQTNEHNALADAKWNYELYNFLNIL